MVELKNLQEMASLASDRFNQYDGADFVLPEIFKEQVKEINSNKISYNKYSAVIETRGSQHGVLNIFMPNQWFYIASYSTDFYNELLKYKTLALKITTKDRLKDLNGRKLEQSEIDNIEGLGLDSKSKALLIRFITDYSWWGGAKTIDRGDFYASPILSYANLVNASQSFVADLCVFLSNKQDLVQAIIINEKNNSANHTHNPNSIQQQTIYDVLNKISSNYRPFITAIKSKPFLLLAGISGTGKSRIVRELARACWEVGSDEYKAQKPSNFEMIQVKPNWHDSSELIGYVSRINGEKFVVGPFLKFVVKAIKDPETPYFLCLDEMNLAPVEQYFAEYLSIVESRKVNLDGTITTDPIIDFDTTEAYKSLIDQLFVDDSERALYLTKDNTTGKRLCLPPNLIVVGTVNMDETTFSFSRKVLDRAMTIEMNDVDLYGGLSEKYEKIGKLGLTELVGSAVEGVDVYETYQSECDIVLQYLQSVNEALNNTPFKIAYRTRNEFLLYVVNNLPYAKDADGNDIAQNVVIARALDEITSMKILSRIEGDDTKVSKNLLDTLSATIKEELQTIVGAETSFESKVSLPKLKEMKTRLECGYTSFWS